MVRKNLIIFLALLWITPQSMAKRSVMTKFRKMHKVNYRQEDETVNSPHSCLHWSAVLIEHLKMVK